MEDEDDVYTASIDELISNFRSALIALVPVAERARMVWADAMEQHYEWEKLQQAVFNAFVAQPIAMDRGRDDAQLPLSTYDIDVADYSPMSWISCQSSLEEDLALVRLVTHEHPFDIVQAAKVDSENFQRSSVVEIPYERSSFCYIRRMRDGKAVRISNIEAVE
ncbi:hypothetical protein [Actinophytocola gossypii]|uniref:Uncharacterized protein n=1 Tax=Actinophytocola gossypii TaxID=2812003 RepID=A0ABT2J9V8_9PSEU|nr:hypothetical protein [Actinophytocola gossypii]MCT2584637.1 hypothetical protein [Actinophytocola gossypii]